MIEYKHFPLFATPVAKTNINLDPNDVLRMRMYHLDTNHQGFEVSGSDSIISDLGLSSLEYQFNEVLKDYKTNVIGLPESIDVVITTSWLINSVPGTKSEIHFHENSFLSGVLALDCIDDYPIQFKRRNYASGLISVIFEHIDPALETNAVPISSGELMLFPSTLLHGTEVNTTQSIPLFLVFNTFISGSIGSGRGRLNINVVP